MDVSAPDESVPLFGDESVPPFGEESVPPFESDEVRAAGAGEAVGVGRGRGRGRGGVVATGEEHNQTADHDQAALVQCHAGNNAATGAAMRHRDAGSLPSRPAVALGSTALYRPRTSAFTAASMTVSPARRSSDGMFPSELFSDSQRTPSYFPQRDFVSERPF